MVAQNNHNLSSPLLSATSAVLPDGNGEGRNGHQAKRSSTGGIMPENSHNPVVKIEPILLTPREAAKVLSISERTLYSLTVPRGDIPVIKSGQLVRYVVDDLKVWAKRKSLESLN